MASSKGQRLLSVFKALEAHPLIGVSNKEIAEGLGISPVHVSRDLEDLIAAGLWPSWTTATLPTASKPCKSPSVTGGRWPT